MRINLRQLNLMKQFMIKEKDFEGVNEIQEIINLCLKTKVTSIEYPNNEMTEVLEILEQNDKTRNTMQRLNKVKNNDT